MITFNGAWTSLLSWLGIESEESQKQYKNPLSYAPVWYAVNKIGGHVGYLPLDVRKQTGRNIEKDFSHPSYRLFRWQPNKMQGPLQFKRATTADALLMGNGIAYIHRSSRGVPLELIPLPVWQIDADLVQGRKVYDYAIGIDDPITRLDPEYAGRIIRFEDEDIFHVAGLGANGFWGYSLLSIAREAWEAGQGGITKLKTLAKKGYAGGLMLSAPPGTSISRDAQKAKEFIDEFEQRHAGADKSGFIGLLREGVTAQVMQMSQQDAQFVETMKFLRQEEALRFMLESILGDDQSVSYNSLEQKNLAYLQNCLNTWLTVWEEEADRKLLTPQEQNSGYFHKFNVGSLLRSDMNTTMRTISLGITSRVLSPNEAREMLDRNPYTGGDEYLNPSIDQAMRGAEPDTEPTRQPQNALKTQIEHMIGIESKRVVNLAKTSKNFLNAIETFYAGWETRLADQVEKLGGDRQAALLHCQESKGQLLLVCDNAKQDTLANQIQALVETWIARSDQFMTDMELLNV